LKQFSISGFLLGFIAVITGFLLSGISFVGRAGINLMYSEYKFLKTWWKGAILVYVVWLLLYVLQSFIAKKTAKKTANMVNIIALLIAVAGLVFSYADFHNTLSHRLLGEHFHLGVYLFWLVWIATSVVLLLRKKETPVELYKPEV
jgi:hypothetical protein